MNTASKILQLPAELRLQIYEHVLDGCQLEIVREAYNTRQPHHQEQFKYKVTSAGTTEAATFPPHPLVYVCKRFYGEVGDLVYQKCLFTFAEGITQKPSLEPAHLDLPLLLSSKVERLLLSCASQLRMLTMYFFPHPEPQEDCQVTSMVFDQLPSLKELYISSQMCDDISKYHTQPASRHCGHAVQRLALLRKNFSFAVHVQPCHRVTKTNHAADFHDRSDQRNQDQRSQGGVRTDPTVSTVYLLCT